MAILFFSFIEDTKKQNLQAVQNNGFRNWDPNKVLQMNNTIENKVKKVRLLGKIVGANLVGKFVGLVDGWVVGREKIGWKDGKVEGFFEGEMEGNEENIGFEIEGRILGLLDGEAHAHSEKNMVWIM